MSIFNKKSLILLTLLIGLFSITGLFDAIDERIYANYLYFNLEKTDNKNIVIVTIDEKSLKGIGKWPFKRNIIAQGLENIIKAKPGVIGIGLAFTEIQNEYEDNTLRKILYSFPNIVLIPKYKKATISNILLQIPEKNLFPDLKYGHNIVSPSKENNVISIQPYKLYPSFAYEIFKIYCNNQKIVPSQELTTLFTSQKQKNYSTNQYIMINFKRNIDQFNKISFIDVLNNKYKPSLFKNKIVFLGVKRGV
jgi:adenylate cyclase